jgi:hypothetical protein
MLKGLNFSCDSLSISSSLGVRLKLPKIKLNSKSSIEWKWSELKSIVWKLQQYKTWKHENTKIQKYENKETWKYENMKMRKHGNANVENADRVLATVKHSALNAVFPVTLRSQFPNLGQPKK